MAREVYNQLVNQIHDEAVLEAAESHFRGRLVDIGCGTKPFADRLRSIVEEHVGVDLPNGPHGRMAIDLPGTAYDIPAPDASFDSALCTAVLEHLEEPHAALNECFRVLIPGGVAIYTVPFIWHLHEEPRDFYRFTSHGLRYLFEGAGFQLVELRPLSGFWVTFGQLLCYVVWRWNRGLVARTRALHVIVWLVQRAARLLERLDPATDWTWMYLVVARRPTEGQA